MKTLAQTAILFVSIATLQFCQSHENNYLAISSLDKEQRVVFDVESVHILQDSALDTTKIHEDVDSDHFDVLDIGKYVKGSNSGSIVLWLTNRKANREGEVSVYLFATLKGKIENLYYAEVEQGSWFWKLRRGVLMVHNDRSYELSGDLASMGFALSGVIKFPLTEQGSYANIKRYLGFEVSIKHRED